MVFMSSGIKLGSKVSFKSMNRVCITVNSHFNIIETNNSDKSSRDYVIGNLNLPFINVHTESSFKKIITLKINFSTVKY